MKKLLLAAASSLVIFAATPALATISSAQATVTDAGNGSTTSFNYPFLIPFQSNGTTPAVNVQMEDNLGNYTTLAQGSAPGQFQISGVGSPTGGAVTFVRSNGSALPSGWVLIITRKQDYVQPTAVSNFTFYPHTVEQMADWQVGLMQQTREIAGRTIQFPRNDSNGFILPAAINRKNLFLGFDANGAPTLLNSPGGLGLHGSVTPGHCASFFSSLQLQDAGAACGSGGGGSASANQITFEQIAAGAYGTGQTYTLSGYRTPGDLGIGMVVTSVLTIVTANCWGETHDSGGAEFCLVPGGQSNPGWFGAYGDGGSHKISAGDVTAHPEWRGTYVGGTTSWDTVGSQEARYMAEATNSLPGSIVWNYPSAPNLILFTPPAPALAYGIDQTLVEGAAFFRQIFAPGSCLVWNGPSTDSMIYMNSNAYGRISGLCLKSNTFAVEPFAGAPMLKIDHFAPVNIALATQQLVFDDLVLLINYNMNGIAINPAGGGTAQGSTVIFNEPEILCSPGTEYAILNDGSNALANGIHNGDIEACSKYSIENLAGTFFIDQTTTENQGYSFFTAPQVSQFTEGGADFFSPTFIASELNHLNWNRGEGDISTICNGVCRIGDGGYMIGVTGLTPWSTETQQVGAVVTPGDGHVMMYVSDGGPTNGNTALGWRNIDQSGSTVCIVNDSGPGSTGFTTNQWQGYGIFGRFFGGFAYHNAVEWNSSTQVSVCNKTNSSISGNTLTVNSVSQGTSDINTGAVVLGAGVPPGLSVTGRLTGTGGAGTYALNQTLGSIASESMDVGHGFPSVPSDEYKIVGITGNSPPTFSSVYNGQSIIGQVDGGGSNQGCSTTAGSTSVTISGPSIANTNWVVIPGASWVGTGVSSTEKIPGVFAAQLSGVSGSTATMNLAADKTLTHVSCYVGAGLADGQETLIDLDFDVLRGITQANDFTATNGRVRSIGGYSNLSFLRTDWNRGTPAGANPGNYSPAYSATYGQLNAQMDACPAISGTVAWPTGGAGSTIKCTVTAAFTLTAPAVTQGQTGDRTIVLVSDGTARVVTFDSGTFNSTGTVTTSATAGKKEIVRFTADGTTYNEVSRAGPE